MSIKRITAIVPTELLPPLEEHLRACGVPGVTVEHVRGYGRHPNYFRRDLMQYNARMVVYADQAEIDGIVAAIKRCAREGGSVAGVLVVESIDRLVRLADDSDVTT